MLKSMATYFYSCCQKCLCVCLDGKGKYILWLKVAIYCTTVTKGSESLSHISYKAPSFCLLIICLKCYLFFFFNSMLLVRKQSKLSGICTVGRTKHLHSSIETPQKITETSQHHTNISAPSSRHNWQLYNFTFQHNVLGTS